MLDADEEFDVDVSVAVLFLLLALGIMDWLALAVEEGIELEAEDVWLI